MWGVESLSLIGRRSSPVVTWGVESLNEEARGTQAGLANADAESVGQGGWSLK